MDQYLAPLETYQHEIEIKRSRFISTVSPVPNKAAAQRVINEMKKRYPDANHHCWAMVAGRPDDVYQCDQSDDGEPKGTAGKPMLNVLLHSGLGNTVLVVTRYFGGIKLGAGGLVRAYTRSASEALAGVGTETQYIKALYQLVLSYSDWAALEHQLKGTQISVDSKTFGEFVELTLAIPQSDVAALEAKLEKTGAKLLSVK